MTAFEKGDFVRVCGELDNDRLRMWFEVGSTHRVMAIDEDGIVYLGPLEATDDQVKRFCPYEERDDPRYEFRNVFPIPARFLEPTVPLAQAAE